MKRAGEKPPVLSIQGCSGCCSWKAPGVHTAHPTPAPLITFCSADEDLGIPQRHPSPPPAYLHLVPTDAFAMCIHTLLTENIILVVGGQWTRQLSLALCSPRSRKTEVSPWRRSLGCPHFWCTRKPKVFICLFEFSFTDNDAAAANNWLLKSILSK